MSCFSGSGHRGKTIVVFDFGGCIRHPYSFGVLQGQYLPQTHLAMIVYIRLLSPQAGELFAWGNTQSISIFLLP